MSRLFLAADTTLRRKVVIKILPPDFSSEIMAARFKREAELTARLQHPHILPIIGAGQANDLLYYVMPYVQGESLRARMDREGALPVHEAIRLLLEIADALAHAHSFGVIHRDIKPENILLQGDHAVVADFGIAGALDAGSRPRISGQTRLTSTGISLGTVGYMAPEQSVGERNVDTRADVYSLGVIGYEMLAGHRLFDRETAQQIVAAHLTEKPAPLDQTVDGIPTPVVLAIEKALEKEPENRFQSAMEFRDALRAQLSPMTTMTRAVPAALIRGAKRRARLVSVRKVAGFAIGILAIGALGAWWRVRASAKPSEIVRIAVAPFDVVDEDPVWREGIVDLMSRNLDGAGALQTVPPSVILKNAHGSYKRDQALQLARQTGAQYVVYGSVFASQGTNSTFRASVARVADDSVIISDFRRTGSSLPALTDSLGLTIIHELSRRHRLGAVDRSAPQGTHSVAALRLFLQGEQLYRRTQWDSAQAVFEQANVADSMFALPLHRRSQIFGWVRSVNDSASRALALRAGSLNRGLAPRDSLLILADSLNAVAVVGRNLNWGALTRLFATLHDGVRKYPGDPEMWYLLGEARYHLGYGRSLGITDRDVLNAFDKSIALDSAFGPAYLHTTEVALNLGEPTSARRYAELYVAHDPNGRDAAGSQLVARLIDGKSSAAVQRMIDSLPWQDLSVAFLILRRWPDSAASALRILQSADRRPRRGDRLSPDTATLHAYLPLELAYRGRMQDAFNSVRSSPTLLPTELAYIGAIPADTADRLFRAWLQTNHPAVRSALSWWALRGDTESIHEFASRATAVLSDAAAKPEQRTRAQYNLAASKAYEALARHDTTASINQFATLSDTACLVCYMDRLVEAKLRRARGDNSAAAALLRPRVAVVLSPLEIPIALERAELAASAGQIADARRDFQTVRDAWSGGDASVGPFVRRAEAGLANLNAKSMASVTAFSKR